MNGSVPDDWREFLGTPLTRRLHAPSRRRTCNPLVTFAHRRHSDGFDFNRPENKKTAEFRGLKELETGAGEGIRTLDPNLGKVVLYP
jgi:hypothetical protein